MTIFSYFLWNVEQNWRLLADSSYNALISSETLWYTDVMRVLPTTSRKELFQWILSTAMLDQQGVDGGFMNFESLTMAESSLEVAFVNRGLRLMRSELEDVDAHGVKLGAQWVRDITIQGAYWPQKLAAWALINGHNASNEKGLLAYDGLAFFSASHLLNPKQASVGTYSNLIGSVPVDASVSASTAVANLSTVASSIMAIKQSNGVDPRNLRPEAIIAGPKLGIRLKQLMNSRIQDNTDFAPAIEALGVKKIIIAPELAGIESDTTYFVKTSAPGVNDGEMSAGIIYGEREPFSITYYTGTGGGTGVDAMLNRNNQLEWHCQGRNGLAYGHPFALVKCTAGA